MTPAGESFRLKLCLRLLTPVFIGSGEKLSRFEYVIEQSGDGQRILIAHVERMLEAAGQMLAPNIVKELEQLALRAGTEQSSAGLGEVISRRIPLGSSNPARWLREKDAVAAALKLHGPPTVLEVQRHIRTPDNRYYIPGSELKGSLRVAVLYRLLCEGTAAEVDRARSNLKRGLEAIQSQENTEEEDEEELTLERLATRLDRQLLRLPGRDGDGRRSRPRGRAPCEGPAHREHPRAAAGPAAVGRAGPEPHGRDSSVHRGPAARCRAGVHADGGAARKRTGAAVVRRPSA
jgi:CRISPR-associated protein Csm5